MDGRNSQLNIGRHRLRMTTAVLGVLSIVAGAATAVGASGWASGSRIKKTAEKHFDRIDIVNEQRICFAAEHGVADPIALAEAVRHSPLADLLISVAIEESRGDPVAIGSSGERGAWQVIASDWGEVPKDIHGQAWQAEKIIRGLLIYAKGNRKKALAHYNGGTVPTRKSYRYAERILKRAGNLLVVATHPPPGYSLLRQVMLGVPGASRQLL